MAEHLPECPMSTKDTICRCLPCICDALRACEQRVQKIAYEQGLGAGSDEHRQHEIGWIKGYDAALAAAVQRVEALEIPYDLPLPVTSKIWNRIISQCVDAIKRDQP